MMEVQEKELQELNLVEYIPGEFEVLSWEHGTIIKNEIL